MLRDFPSKCDNEHLYLPCHKFFCSFDIYCVLALTGNLKTTCTVKVTRFTACIEERRRKKSQKISFSYTKKRICTFQQPERSFREFHKPATKEKQKTTNFSIMYAVKSNKSNSNVHFLRRIYFKNGIHEHRNVVFLLKCIQFTETISSHHNFETSPECCF